MLKKRLIFILLYKNGNFYLSRNFRLQKVGGVDWLLKNYNFEKIVTAIDELVILNLSGDIYDIDIFFSDISKITKNCFIPIALGGGIQNIEKASNFFKNGADKIVINTFCYKDPKLIEEISNRYGSQSIVASVDFKIKADKFLILIENGSQIIEMDLQTYLHYLEKQPVGELLLNSIDKDGTGQGFQMDLIAEIDNSFSKPIIISGGAGNSNHLFQGLEHPKVNAVATANLFNFVGNGLPNARKLLLDQGCELARW